MHGSFMISSAYLKFWSYVACLVLFCALHVCSYSAYAQTIPSSADLSRVTKPFEKSQRVIPDFVSPKTKGEFQALQPPKGAGEYHFTLKKLIIEGSSVYGQDELLPLYSAIIDTEVSVAEVFDIANAITQKYRDDGYILAYSIIPPQEIDDGEVKIGIVEGSVDRVYADGLDVEPSSLIQDIMNKIQGKTAFNVQNLEKRLLLLNRMTGYSAYSVLEPAENGSEGAINIKIVFEPSKNIYRVGADNYGSHFVGPWQGSLSARIPHHKYVHGETNIAVYSTPHVNELKFFSLSNTSLLNSKGLTMDSSIRLSRSEPGESLADVDLASRYLSLRIKFEQPLMLSRQKQFNVFGSFNYTNSSSDVLAARFFDDRLRAVRIGFNGYTTNLYGGSLQGRATLSQGLDIMGARETGAADLSRERGRSDFTKLDAQISYRTAFLGNFGLNTTLSGQYSVTPLLSSEEFGYGGYSIGRAYNNSEITGDSGVAALAELSYYKWSHYKGRGLKPGFVPFIYYDVGKIWNQDRDAKPESAASAGVGLQMNWGSLGAIRATMAQPLSRSVANPVRGNGKNPRFLVSFQKQF